MVTVSDTINKITDRLQAAATAKTVYGEPLLIEGKTLIPVAKVRYGFGAGSAGDADENPDGGGGGGGGVEISPIGVIEITPGETRYVSLEGPRAFIKYALVAMAIIALAVGLRQARR